MADRKGKRPKRPIPVERIPDDNRPTDEESDEIECSACRKIYKHTLCRCGYCRTIPRYSNCSSRDKNKLSEVVAV